MLIMMGQRSSLPSVLFTSLLLSATAQATCYNPDGSEVTNPAFQPCNQVVGQFSMCCGTNWTGGVVMPDTCQANGLCLNSYDNAPLYWRGSCTDPTWKSPNCLANLCASDGDAGVDGSAATQNVAVTECSDGTWCCGGGNQDCCNNGTGTRIAAVVGQAISSSQSSSLESTSSTLLRSSTSSTLLESTTSVSESTSTPQSTSQTTDITTIQSMPPLTNVSPIATSTTSSTDSPESTSQSTSDGLSSGTKIGLGVGVAGCLLAIGMLVTCLVCLRRKGRVGKDTEGFEGNAPRSRASMFAWSRHEMPASPNEKPLPPYWHEVSGNKSPTELSGMERPAELSSERWSRGM